MRGVVIAFSMMCGACATAGPQAASAPPAPVAAAAKSDRAKPAKTKRVCERVDEDPGSRIGGKLVCREVKVAAPTGGATR